MLSASVAFGRTPGMMISLWSLGVAEAASLVRSFALSNQERTAATFQRIGQSDAGASILRQPHLSLEDRPVPAPPVSSVLPYPVDEELRDADITARMLRKTAPMPANAALRLPGFALPVDGDAEWPVGVQAGARHFRDDLCQDAAEIVEAHRPPAPPVSPSGAP
jgi:hypothetical protein